MELISENLHTFKELLFIVQRNQNVFEVCGNPLNSIPHFSLPNGKLEKWKRTRMFVFTNIFQKEYMKFQYQTQTAENCVGENFIY
jgi:hypothetical protein